jgi:hypothetical protein
VISAVVSFFKIIFTFLLKNLALHDSSLPANCQIVELTGVCASNLEL